MSEIDVLFRRARLLTNLALRDMVSALCWVAERDWNISAQSAQTATALSSSITVKNESDK